MSAARIEKLVKMANQIGDFFAPMPDQEATEGVATHLRRYWTPKMICGIISYVGSGGGALHPVVARAVDLLERDCRTSA
jgi:formate dehydrogenase subunit delta